MVLAKRVVEMPTKPTKARPTNLSRVTIERLAEQVSSLFGYDPEFTLADIVSRLGGRLIMKDYS
jgi:hypothetical protein